MTFKKVHIFLIVILMITINSFSSTKVIDDIVLSISSCQITYYEVQKNYLEFKEEFKFFNKRNPAPKDISQWPNDFKMNTILLADAYELGYNNIDYVIKEVEGTERVILTQMKGLVYNELFQDNKNSLYEEYLNYQSFTNKIKSSIYIQVDSAVCKKFFNYFKECDMFTGNIDKRTQQTFLSHFNDIENNIIVRYNINDRNDSMDVKTFFINYVYQPMQSIFQTAEKIEQYLHDYVVDEYILLIADSLKVRETTKFKLDKKNYLNKVMLGYYIKDHIVTMIDFSDKNIQKYYKENLSNYTAPEVVNISRFTCNNMEDATLVYTYLQENDCVDCIFESELFAENKIYSFEGNISMKMKDYGIEFIEQLSYLQINEISYPEKIDDKYVIMIKISETGSMTLPFGLIQDRVVHDYTDSEINRLKHLKASHLRNKYKFKIDDLYKINFEEL